jgi:D-glycero-alpha-D-manno-heptose-7-phosphate kinase
MIITRAPLRVSFFGGGTDFPEYFLEHGGAVLSTAIDKFSYITASHFHSHLFGYSLRLSYSKGELVERLDDIQHSVFRECLRYCGFTKDIELHTVADLPSFSGLGTSSSFTVALLLALHAFKGERVEPIQLAYEAIHIERHVLNECVGVQDQAISAMGGFNILEFKAEDDIRVHPVTLPVSRRQELEAHSLMVFTGTKRRAAEIEKSKIVSLDANVDSLSEMHQMVDKGYRALTSEGTLERFGRLLDQAWKRKRSLGSLVSNEAIQRMYDAGVDAGAWGGKLLGAGGGGFLLFCAPPEAHPRILASLGGHHHLTVSFAAPGCSVIFQEDGARFGLA